jgi:hypothetical protein
MAALHGCGEARLDAESRCVDCNWGEGVLTRVFAKVLAMEGKAAGVMAGVMVQGALDEELLRAGENSSILALLGGTSGPGVSPPFDSSSGSSGSGTDGGGIEIGARTLGEGGGSLWDKSSDLGTALRLS